MQEAQSGGDKNEQGLQYLALGVLADILLGVEQVFDDRLGV